jgi:hypothetical protein
MNDQKTSPPLQSGAKLLAQTATVRTGTLKPQEVDASLDLVGLTWFRVHGGFGGRFDREDWIADLPGVSVTVCDYHWNGSDFGLSYGSFEAACRGQLEFSLQNARTAKSEAETKLATLAAAIARMEQCLDLEHTAQSLAEMDAFTR